MGSRCCGRLWGVPVPLKCPRVTLVEPVSLIDSANPTVCSLVVSVVPMQLTPVVYMLYLLTR
jgi:hypothetical protein